MNFHYCMYHTLSFNLWVVPFFQVLNSLILIASISFYSQQTLPIGFTLLEYQLQYVVKHVFLFVWLTFILYSDALPFFNIRIKTVSICLFVSNAMRLWLQYMWSDVYPAQMCIAGRYIIHVGSVSGLRTTQYIVLQEGISYM